MTTRHAFMRETPVIPPLQSLEIKNFKAYSSAHIPIRPITLIYGQNSAGKSSVIDSLVWAAHMGQQGLPGGSPADWNFDFDMTGSHLRLGRFGDFVHRKISKNEISLNFSFGCDSALGAYAGGGTFILGEKQLSVHCELQFNQARGLNQFSVSTGKARTPLFSVTTLPHGAIGSPEWNFDNPELAIYLAKVLAQFYQTIPDEIVENSNGQVPPWDGESDWHQNEILSSVVDKLFGEDRIPRFFSMDSIPPERIDSNRATGVPYGQDDFEMPKMDHLPIVPDDALRELIVREGSGFLQDALDHKLNLLLEPLRALLNNTVYLGPLRGSFDTQKLRIGQPKPDSNRPAVRAGTNGSDAREWNLSNESIRFVNKWLKDRSSTDTNYELRAVSYKAPKGQKRRASRLALIDRNRNLEVGFHEVGSGIGQFLPVLLAAAAANSAPICIKQPELHLHPSLQSDIADIFLHFALGSRNFTPNIFVIETHSEHLLLRIMRRIRETSQGRLAKGKPPVRPSDVSIVYVENIGRESIVREMPLNEKGELVRDWPGGFFEEGLREVLY